MSQQNTPASPTSTAPTSPTKPTECTSTADKLTKLLGSDPAQGVSITAAILQEAVKELHEEDNKERKIKAKELLVRAKDLRKQMVKAKKEYLQQEQKAEKELSKLVSQIERIAAGGVEEEPQQT